MFTDGAAERCLWSREKRSEKLATVKSESDRKKTAQKE
jgi:hypothetical protein